MKKPGCRRGMRCACIVLLTLCLSVPGWGKETVTLTSSDGRELEVVLLERGKDAVKVEVGRRIHILPFERLSEESVAMVKKADLPVMCNFELKVDLRKRGDKVEKNRTETIRVGNELVRQTVTDSYRVDEVDGVASVENRDVSDESPAGIFHLLVLANANGRHVVMHKASHKLEALEPLRKFEVEVEQSKSWHSDRGEPFSRGGIKVEGRYAGYLAAVVVEGQVVAVKSNTGKYEEDMPTVRRLLGLPRKVGKAE